MPITLYDQDGNPQEVPSAEEIAAYQESQAKVDELLQEKQELEAAAHPNWKAIRDKEKKMKEALKAVGKDVDDDGNITEKKEVSRDEILGEAKKMFQEETFVSEKERLLAAYGDADKTTISVLLDKLMSGEDKTISNLHKFVDQATAFVFPEQDNRSKRSAFSSNGHAANLTNDGKPSEGTVAMGQAFGLSDKDLENTDASIKF